jgi:hypothetical protein
MCLSYVLLIMRGCISENLHPKGRGEDEYIPFFAAPTPRRRALSNANEAKELRK